MPLEQRDRELAAIGASIGANCRPCIEHHVTAGRDAALDAGLEAHQIKSALKMAGYVQQHAASITAEEVARVLAEQVGVPAETAAGT